jgi:hypothetical protein
LATHDDNPFQAPVDGAARPAVPAPLDRKRLWIAFAGWVGASCLLNGVGGTTGLAMSTTDLGGFAQAAPLFGVLAFRTSGPEIASVAAALAVVTAVHRRRVPAGVRARWAAFYPVFVAAPLASLLAASLVIVLSALTLSRFGVGMVTFVDQAVRAVTPEHVGLGIVMAAARAAVCGVVVTSGLKLLLWPRWLIARIALTWFVAVLATLPLELALVLGGSHVNP